MDKYLSLIKKSFNDKEFVAKLLHDSIPEYKDFEVEQIAEKFILDEEADIEYCCDEDGNTNKIIVNFNALSPNDDGYIGFTVNFVIWIIQVFIFNFLLIRYS